MEVRGTLLQFYVVKKLHALLQASAEVLLKKAKYFVLCMGSPTKLSQQIIEMLNVLLNSRGFCFSLRGRLVMPFSTSRYSSPFASSGQHTHVGNRTKPRRIRCSRVSPIFIHSMLQSRIENKHRETSSCNAAINLRESWRVLCL